MQSKGILRRVRATQLDTGLKLNSGKSKGRDQLLAVYVVNNWSAGFDFGMFIAAAHQEARSRGYHFIRLVLVWDRENLTDFNRLKGTLHDGYLKWRMTHLVMPMALLAQRIQTVELTTREADLRSLFRGNDVFPRSARPWFYPNWHSKAIRRDAPLSCMSASNAALQAAEAWLDEVREGKPVVSLTLRSRMRDQVRNTRLPEWIQFAEYLDAQGFCPIFLPDTESLLRGERGVFRFASSESASLDMEYRLALYELAYCNFFYSNGPATLAMLDPKVNFVFHLPILNESLFASEDAYRDLGFTVGASSFPYVEGTHHLSWKSDDFENLVASFDHFQNALA